MKLIKEVLEVQTTHLRDGNAAMLATLLHIVILSSVIVAMDLGIKLKIVGVHRNNP